MPDWASYPHSNAVRVFALFAGLAFASGLLATYASGVSDIAKFGGPIAGFAAAIFISKYLGWLTVSANWWQYLKAAVGVGIAMPAAFVAYVAMSVLIVSALGKLMPSMTNDHPLYIASAYLAMASGSSVFPLVVGYSLFVLSGVWDWWLLGAIYVVMWLALLSPSPWDRPFVSAVGGMIGLWLSRSGR